MHKNQPKYTEKWQAENVERLTIKPNLKYRLSERIQAQIEKGCAKSRQDYIIQAVLSRLEQDEKAQE